MTVRIAAAVLFLLALRPAAAADVLGIPRTGQELCYDAIGVVIPCDNTGQDGDLRSGAAWPSPRFTDNGDGTVSDNMTGLVWLKDADCADTAGRVEREGGTLDWPSALAWCNNLSGGICGLSDNSAPGDWRLPNINELRSLVDYSRHDPSLPLGHPFANVRPAWYWSSTSNPVYTGGAFTVGMSRGSIHATGKVRPGVGDSRVENKTDRKIGVWAVRGGIRGGRNSRGRALP